MVAPKRQRPFELLAIGVLYAFVQILASLAGYRATVPGRRMPMKPYRVEEKEGELPVATHIAEANTPFEAVERVLGRKVTLRGAADKWVRVIDVTNVSPTRLRPSSLSSRCWDKFDEYTLQRPMTLKQEADPALQGSLIRDLPQAGGIRLREDRTTPARVSAGRRGRGS